jgi:hypothetical protein
MAESRVCESCGMPMRKPEEFGGGKTDNRYCVYCCDSDGNLKSYDDMVKGMTQFMMKTQGISEEQAEIATKEHLAKMPAWSDVPKHVE